MDPLARTQLARANALNAIINANSEKIGQAMFAAYGTNLPPDATFTLRLSYGQVKGWKEGTREIEPYTTVGGAFERATGRDPFALPESWIETDPLPDVGPGDRWFDRQQEFVAALNGPWSRTRVRRLPFCGVRSNDS